MIQLTADKTSFAAPGRPGAPSPAAGLSLFALPDDPAAALAAVPESTDERQTPAAPGIDLPAAPDPALLALFVPPTPPAPVAPAQARGDAVVPALSSADPLAMPDAVSVPVMQGSSPPLAADTPASPPPISLPPELRATASTEQPAATPDSPIALPARSPALTPAFAGEPRATSLLAPNPLQRTADTPFSTPASPVTIPAYASPSRPAPHLASRAMAAPEKLALAPQSPLVLATPGPAATGAQPTIAGSMLPSATVSGWAVDRATPPAELALQPPATDRTVPPEAAPAPVLTPAIVPSAALPFRWQVAADAAVAIVAPAPGQGAVVLAPPKLDVSAPAAQLPPLAPQPVGAPPTLAVSAAALFAEVSPVEERSSRDQLAPPITAGLTLAPAAPALAPPAPTTMLDLRQERWPHDMMAQIEVLRDAADAADTRIRLIPDALGSVDVDVRRDGDTLHVRFSAEQAQTRALLQDAQPRLAEAAEARGLRLGQASVDAGIAGQGQQRSPTPQDTPTPRRPVPSPAPSPVRAAAEAAEDDRIA